jgi:hypothetical protein
MLWNLFMDFAVLRSRNDWFSLNHFMTFTASFWEADSMAFPSLSRGVDESGFETVEEEYCCWFCCLSIDDEIPGRVARGTKRLGC